MSGPVLFVECGDSFSFNVLDALPVRRTEVDVRTPSGALEALTSGDPRAVILGPGPFDPEKAGLLPIVHVLEARSIATLGICLGHQALGVHFGASLVPVEPKHGVREAVFFEQSRLMPHVHGSTKVMRYHSLALATPLPGILRGVAYAEDGTLMALEHRSLPMLGLQFHPDSFATPSGEAMIRDFFRATLERDREAAP
jgi:anthranilate synthase/aminodeoxychorismate synthase-like glutamine amidotransferase